MPEKITLGVTGGIAAYRAAELVRALQTRDFDVHVVMTRAAEEFIRPLTFASLTGRKVIRSLWTDDATTVDGDSSIEHIAEAQSTRALLVAPATAHTLARFAHGLADDFLSTLYLATTAPVIVAPAMNVNMWQHPATQANIATLRTHGVHIIEPESGYLACGMTGGGRLANLETIVDTVTALLRPAQPSPAQTLAGETILITAGGTREPIDPVRFLGNRSSGKMGYALASAALARGARVILISGPSSLPPPTGCLFVPVITGAEMHSAVLHYLPSATIVIAAAAAADFRAAQISPHKLKRSGALILNLESTPDIVRAVVERKSPGTTVIAFAAESQNLLENARAKLHAKQVDAIVANDISQPHLGFDSDRNAAIWITAQECTPLPETTKTRLAEQILNHTQNLRLHTQS